MLNFRLGAPPSHSATDYPKEANYQDVHLNEYQKADIHLCRRNTLRRITMRRKYGFDEKKIARFIREGRGRGTGKEYKPWLLVSDVPSTGREHRVFWCRTEREHHFLSDNEFRAFLSLAWLENVIDIREQFPLDRSETMQIASRLGIRHPVVGGTILFLTTDLLVTVMKGDQLMLFAYAIKEDKDRSKERVKELLEIESCYWWARGISWDVLTNLDVKTTATKNLEWIFGLNGMYPVTSLDEEIHRRLWSLQTKYPLVPMNTACEHVDKQLSRPIGTALEALRRLLGARKILVDMNIKVIQSLPMKEFLFKG
jgi:hypothetical protein